MSQPFGAIAARVRLGAGQCARGEGVVRAVQKLPSSRQFFPAGRYPNWPLSELALIRTE